jgi:hypothetical protein
MPDVHLPHLDGPQRRSLLKIALEVALISVGVFLGLAGEQWRETAHHHEMAEEALRRFRTELMANRQAVAKVKDYHATTRTAVETYLAADSKTRSAADVQIAGLQPASFNHTAWDLALATQSLAYIDSSLAFALAHIYNSQQGYADLTRGVVQAMYLRPPSENLDAFLRALALYYDDVVLIEPELIKMYDELLPQIDRALGETD